MEQKPSRRPIIFLALLIIAVSVFAILVVWVWVQRSTPNEFIFDQIQDGKRVGNGRFVFESRSGEVALINSRTRQSFSIPADFDLAENGSCENCATFISVPQQDGYITLEFATKKNWPCDECVFESDIEYVDYLVTRNHNGGSGGYYMHHVFRVEHDGITKEASYLSCDTVYLAGHILTFTYHVDDCQLFRPSWWGNANKWEDDIHLLRDN